MALSAAAGKHRRPRRRARRAATAAGVAALAAAAGVGTLAAPASAAERPVESTGLLRAVSMEGSLARRTDEQAAAQQHAADEAAAKKRAARKAAEAGRGAAKRRAARAAERRRLNSFAPPITGSSVSTGYRTGGPLRVPGSHTGIDFHAASGTPVHAVGAGAAVEAGWGGAYGNNVVLRMADGTFTRYGHLSSLGVTVGQKATRGGGSPCRGRPATPPARICASGRAARRSTARTSTRSPTCARTA